ncbi:MAG: calcium:proton antiporter [Candidatus Cloacimonas sp. SDB]|nr:MAG: calcium:proton antiporter [Candidatus Cloacimonas sp. SDB]
MKKKKLFQIFELLTLLFLTLLILTSCNNQYDELNLEAYQYRDTRELVKFVYQSALKFEAGGPNRLKHFQNNRNLYQNDNFYLYIYKLDGTNVFHSGMPQLEGNNLPDITDVKSKKLFQLVTEALANENNPHAWMHYMWWTPGKFYPVPKSSCHFKVKTEDGTEYFVGGGLDYPQEEKEFIRIIVDTAAEQIQLKGLSAMESIADPLSQYNFRDVKIFAFQEDGEILISPVLESNLADLRLVECTDQVKHKPFVKALENLQNSNSTWEVFMAKDRYQRTLIKKSLYLKKVDLADKTIYVGAITDLPQPPWTG